MSFPSLLVRPGDVYACRQPDPVLQQVEQTHNLSISTNDAFKAVCRYWDRVVRPEQLMSAMISAFRVLTDPANTGAVCVAMPQDVEGERVDCFFHGGLLSQLLTNCKPKYKFCQANYIN